MDNSNNNSFLNKRNIQNSHLYISNKANIPNKTNLNNINLDELIDQENATKQFIDKLEREKKILKCDLNELREENYRLKTTINEQKVRINT